MNSKRPPLPQSTASSIHCFSTTIASSSIDGLLFGHVTFVTHLSDDSSDSSQTLLATITTVSNPETTFRNTIFSLPPS
ncbi:hypothetical protein TSUD_54400 [Trifolium subterraneum]|uniref:Uncharacterized protein n=1 Tax=Trifolium subterraneum TaxID=3900 RepID=A0A2Z6NQ84_TRISU|nr:hypothetical protein TSUD_54400 [Trifolium subterraneum]